jgi:hypothetical protein
VVYLGESVDDAWDFFAYCNERKKKANIALNAFHEISNEPLDKLLQTPRFIYLIEKRIELPLQSMRESIDNHLEQAELVVKALIQHANRDTGLSRNIGHTCLIVSVLSKNAQSGLNQPIPLFSTALLERGSNIIMGAIVH